MLISTVEFIFIDMNEGVGKQSQKPYRFIKLANPDTFENYSLSADARKNFPEFTKGEKVQIELNMTTFFNNINLEITDIYPAIS